jgi:uncharacterized protein HemY
LAVIVVFVALLVLTVVFISLYAVERINPVTWEARPRNSRRTTQILPQVCRQTLHRQQASQAIRQLASRHMVQPSKPTTLPLGNQLHQRRHVVLQLVSLVPQVCMYVQTE